MSLLDDLKNLGDQAQNQLDIIQDTVIPIEIQNLKQSHDRINEELTKLENSGLTSNNPQALAQITHLRTFLMSHFGHLMRGGEPEPVLGGKSHPLYIEVKESFNGLDERLSALEEQYLKCRFGYQAADGQILKPSLSWAEAEWLEIKNSSRDNLARCWLIEDKNRYY